MYNVSWMGKIWPRQSFLINLTQHCSITPEIILLSFNTQISEQPSFLPIRLCRFCISGRGAPEQRSGWGKIRNDRIDRGMNEWTDEKVSNGQTWGDAGDASEKPAFS